MKKFFILTITACSFLFANAQDIKKQIETAKSSYSSGNLQETHFTLQQMMQQIDITIGKEILKLLPAKADTLTINGKDDNVMAHGLLGATTERTYGNAANKVEVQVMSNSPVATSLNAMLTSPYFNNDGKTSIIKVQGFKAKLTRDEEVKGYYTLEIPFSNALLTIKANGSSEAAITAFASSIPLNKIDTLVK